MIDLVEESNNSKLHYENSRLFPYLMSKRNDNFKLSQCSYEIDNSKKNCARSVFYNKLGFRILKPIANISQQTLPGHFLHISGILYQQQKFHPLISSKCIFICFNNTKYS